MEDAGDVTKASNIFNFLEISQVPTYIYLCMHRQKNRWTGECIYLRCASHLPHTPVCFDPVMHVNPGTYVSSQITRPSSSLCIIET